MSATSATPSSSVRRAPASRYCWRCFPSTSPRFIGAQVIFFDRGRSARAATLAMAGAAIELSLEGSLALQPLARIDEAGEIAFALQWVIALFANEGIKVTPDVKDAAWSALK